MRGISRIAILVCALAGFAPAPATAADYDAAFVDQCCFAQLESGEVRDGQFFQLRNTGAQPWRRAEAVRLGIDHPTPRTSLFVAPSWLLPNRPAELAEAEVLPGAVGSFRFTVKAPSVSASTVFKEDFMILREAVTWFGPGMWLQYTVLPSVPPNVAIGALPAEIQAGTAVAASATATDNNALASVEFLVDGRSAVFAKGAPDGRTYTASLPTTGLEPGSHRVTARATDRAGNVATSEQVFTLRPVTPPPSSTPSPETSPASSTPETLRRLGAFRPVFATRAQRRGRFMGRLYTAEVLITGGSRLDIVCAKGCARARGRLPRRSVRRIPGRKTQRYAVTLRPAWKLRRTAEIEIRVIRNGFAIRFERYRFRRSGVGLRAKQVSAGCLLSILPRRQQRCPSP